MNSNAAPIVSAEAHGCKLFIALSLSGRLHEMGHEMVRAAITEVSCDYSIALIHQHFLATLAFSTGREAPSPPIPAAPLTRARHLSPHAVRQRFFSNVSGRKYPKKCGHVLHLAGSRLADADTYARFRK
jgi:hypothetical protein